LSSQAQYEENGNFGENGNISFVNSSLSFLAS